MKPSQILLLLFFTILTRAQNTYKVATFLYSPVSDDQGKTIDATIKKNYDRLAPYAKQSKDQGVQLILFPESITGTLVWPDMSFQKVTEYAEVYPAVGSKVCSSGYSNLYQHYTAACMAVNNTMYVVINIPEKLDCRGLGSEYASDDSDCKDLSEKRIYNFNSLAVYDPSGELIAKYRKTMTNTLLYDPAYPNSNKQKVDLTTFKTNFGVEFAVMICADAFNPFIAPKYAQQGIKNWLIPYYDGGRPPVYSITSIHQGHSYNFGVNIIGSQSQTYSGVGIYENSNVVVWKINQNLSDNTYVELIVQDVNKEPPAIDRSLTPKEITVTSLAQIDTCRWLGGMATEVNCPCIEVEVPRRTQINFIGNLTQPVEIDGKVEQFNCSIEATLQGQGTDQKYAMMIGWRNSTLSDFTLFCELVVCNDFPDCSKGCPSCTAPYIGNSDLTAFNLQAKAPEYFQGERQMHFPMMNSFEGAPIIGDNYDWKSENGKRYMSLRSGKQVPKLMSAGVFHIGFAPKSLLPPTPPDDKDDGSDGLSRGALAGIIIACVVVAVIIALVVIYCVRRSRKLKQLKSDTMHEEIDKRDSFIQT